MFENRFEIVYLGLLSSGNVSSRSVCALMCLVTESCAAFRYDVRGICATLSVECEVCESFNSVMVIAQRFHIDNSGK